MQTCTLVFVVVLGLIAEPPLPADSNAGQTAAPIQRTPDDLTPKAKKALHERSKFVLRCPDGSVIDTKPYYDALEVANDRYRFRVEYRERTGSGLRQREKVSEGWVLDASDETQAWGMRGTRDNWGEPILFVGEPDAPPFFECVTPNRQTPPFLFIDSVPRDTVRRARKQDAIAPVVRQLQPDLIKIEFRPPLVQSTMVQHTPKECFVSLVTTSVSRGEVKGTFVLWPDLSSNDPDTHAPAYAEWYSGEERRYWASDDPLDHRLSEEATEFTINTVRPNVLSRPGLVFRCIPVEQLRIGPEELLALVDDGAVQLWDWRFEIDRGASQPRWIREPVSFPSLKR